MAVDDENKVIAVARLQFNSGTEAQIRYMAVEKEHERKGIGSRMIHTIERHAAKNSHSIITLDARECAIGFYEKLGYKIRGKSYLLFDEIQHYSMVTYLFSPNDALTN